MFKLWHSISSYLDNGLRDFEKENFDNIRVWFNNKGWAASVAYMNAVNNIVLRAGIAEQGSINVHKIT